MVGRLPRNMSRNLRTHLTYLCSGLQAAGKLHLVDTVVHWLSVSGAFGHRAFTASTAYTNTIDDVTCQRGIRHG